MNIQNDASKQIEISLASEEDALGIYDVNCASLGYTFPLENTLKRVSALLKRCDDRIWVAKLDGKLIGYAHATSFECSYTEPLKYLHILGVLPEYQNFGVGKLLIAKAEQWALEDGCAGVTLVSGVARLAAHQFYLKRNYKNTKDEKFFIKYFDEK